MKKKAVSVLIITAFCTVTLLFSSDPVQAGKYVYYNEKGEQVDSLTPKPVNKKTEKKSTKVRNRSGNSDNTRSVGIPLVTGKDKTKSVLKK